jgi:protein-S-isoprenylcysteine O-methyltransferase Ste14
MRGVWLFLRSAFWTIVFPGFIAGYVPWRYFEVSEVPFDHRNPVHLVGLLLIALGAALLLACIYEFARRGRGTLSPADPPKELVVQGLYRYVRNPMYLSVLTIIAGEVVLTRSGDLAIYWLCFFLATSIFVLGFEEPYLRSRFGDSYERYTREVGRWIPRLTPAAGNGPPRGQSK